MIDATAGARPKRDRFFANTALIMLVMVLSPFPFTYLSPMGTAGSYFAPIHHIHALAYFAWIGLYAWQTHLIASGRTARHRELGLAGIALSALLVPLGVMLAIAAIHRRMAAGNANPFDFTLYNMVDLLTFSVLVIASFAAVTRHLDWHRRFIFGAALCLVGPAISRWFIPLPALPPFTDWGPNILADLLLISLALHDRRSLGKIHPATLWVIAALVPIHLLTPFAASSDWWRELAPGLLQLMG